MIACLCPAIVRSYCWLICVVAVTYVRDGQTESVRPRARAYEYPVIGSIQHFDHHLLRDCATHEMRPFCYHSHFRTTYVAHSPNALASTSFATAASYVASALLSLPGPEAPQLPPLPRALSWVAAAAGGTLGTLPTSPLLSQLAPWALLSSWAAEAPAAWVLLLLSGRAALNLPRLLFSTSWAAVATGRAPGTLPAPLLPLRSILRTVCLPSTNNYFLYLFLPPARWQKTNSPWWDDSNAPLFVINEPKVGVNGRTIVIFAKIKKKLRQYLFFSSPL